MKVTASTDTRTPATEERYRNVAAQLMAKFERETQTRMLDNIELMVDWLAARRPQILPKTWRQYKASLAFFLDSLGHHNEASRLRDLTSEGCKSRSNNTSRQTSTLKRKHITQLEEETITKYLFERSKSSWWVKPCLAFFKAGIIVGLRPSEWASAKIFVDGSVDLFPAYPVLRVANGKATNGRSHGKYRHLVLDDLSEVDLLWVRTAVAFANPDNTQGFAMGDKKAADFDEYYQILRKGFKRTIDKLYPGRGSRITLYSCRHQFSANVKAAKYNLAEIAAMMGHGTDETASAHYGRKRFGRSRSGLPRPLNEETLRVRAVHEGRPNINKPTARTPSPQMD